LFEGEGESENRGKGQMEKQTYTEQEALCGVPSQDPEIMT